MSTTTVVRARIEEGLKDQATAALTDMGLTISEAIRLMLVQVVAEKRLPFEVRVPNKKTLSVLEKTDQGEELHESENLEDMFKKLAT
jgi:DNA-damage-inducible protein J